MAGHEALKKVQIRQIWESAQNYNCKSTVVIQGSLRFLERASLPVEYMSSVRWSVYVLEAVLYDSDVES